MTNVTTTNSSVAISESIGSVSTVTISPAKPKAVLILAHGAGAGMNHRFMENLAGHLAGHSLATIRYNFPYMEKGSKRPDVPAVAEKTVEVLLHHATQTFSSIPLFLAGKSFGGRMSSQFVSKKHPSNVQGIVFYGFPLHAAGQPGIERADHLKSISTPMLFLQGTKDALADLALIEKVCAALPSATLVKFEGADHSFKIKKTEPIGELAASTNQWIENIIS
jgi:predicted alpha/beta-hydrolase family hydrolase